MAINILPTVLLVILGLFFQTNLHGRYVSHSGQENDQNQNDLRMIEGKLAKEIRRNWDRFITTLSERHDKTALANAVQNTRETNKISYVNHSMMGIPLNSCDNAQDNLDVDWNGSPVDYTCYNPKEPLPFDSFSQSQEPTSSKECEDVPKGYFPKHVCMNTEIKYSSTIPTHEDHRPLWATYGEYLYVPPQRWLHNIEHGGIVMLYHPCTHPAIVNALKSILKGCIRKHVITAAPLRSEWPIAFVGWGCRLQMNTVDTNALVAFIKEYGLNGPEGKMSDEGVYNLTLIEKAKIPEGSDFDDAILCPAYN